MIIKKYFRLKEMPQDPCDLATHVDQIPKRGLVVNLLQGIKNQKRKSLPRMVNKNPLD